MDAALLTLHALVGALFVGHGAQKLFGAFGGHGIAGTAGFMASLGLRPGRLHALAAGAAELVGGALLLLGLLLPLAAALIVATMTTATLTAHRGKGPWVSDGGYEYPLVMIAVALALATGGGGEYALDSVLELGLTGEGWGFGSVGVGIAGGITAALSGQLAPARHRGGAQAQGA